MAFLLQNPAPLLSFLSELPVYFMGNVVEQVEHVGSTPCPGGVDVFQHSTVLRGRRCGQFHSENTYSAPIKRAHHSPRAPPHLLLLAETADPLVMWSRTPPRPHHAAIIHPRLPLPCDGRRLAGLSLRETGLMDRPSGGGWGGGGLQVTLSAAPLGRGAAPGCGPVWAT